MQCTLLCVFEFSDLVFISVKSIFIYLFILVGEWKSLSFGFLMSNNLHFKNIKPKL